VYTGTKLSEFAKLRAKDDPALTQKDLNEGAPGGKVTTTEPVPIKTT
jgi:hypothetical protein